MNVVHWVGLGLFGVATVCVVACGGGGTSDGSAAGGEAVVVGPSTGAPPPASATAAPGSASSATPAPAPMSTTSLRCDADGPLCGMDVPDLGQLTDDQFGMLFTCKSHVLTPVCLCQLSAATSLFCSAGACTCAVGDPMPTTVGACVDTSVAAVGGRLSGDTDFETGVAIGFTNGGFQVTFDHDDAMIHSQAGDAVHTCLVELPQNCPPGDTRGKIYKTTNARTGESWTQANSSHGCGGA